MNDNVSLNDISQQTPGQIIKAAREAKQISLTDVAQRLLLSKQIITALEEDNYSKISAKVYAEGYLKAYAQFLKIPVDMVLASFRNLNAYPEKEVSSNKDSQDNKNLKKLLKNKGKSLALLVLPVLFVLLLLILLLAKSLFHKSSNAPTGEPNSSISTESGALEVEQLPLINSTVGEGVLETEAKQNSSKEKDKNKGKEKEAVFTEQSGAEVLDIDIPAEKNSEKGKKKR